MIWSKRQPTIGHLPPPTGHQVNRPSKPLIARQFSTVTGSSEFQIIPLKTFHGIGKFFHLFTMAEY